MQDINNDLEQQINALELDKQAAERNERDFWEQKFKQIKALKQVE
jgi:hypothetical protein